PPTPLTRTRRNARLAGLEPTSSTVLLPQLVVVLAALTEASASTTATGGPHVQSGWQRPGQAPPSAPSHCSPLPSTTLSPQRGGGAQVQSRRHRPGHAELADPSHCSLGWFTRLSPQLG